MRKRFHCLMMKVYYKLCLLCEAVSMKTQQQLNMTHLVCPVRSALRELHHQQQKLSPGQPCFRPLLELLVWSHHNTTKQYTYITYDQPTITQCIICNIVINMTRHHWIGLLTYEAALEVCYRFLCISVLYCLPSQNCHYSKRNSDDVAPQISQLIR